MNIRKMCVLILFLLFSSSFSVLYCQNTEKEASYIDLNKWQTGLVKTEVLKYKGKTALRITEAPGERIAYLKDFTFENGIIELDIAAIPFYTGLVFLVRSESVYEGIYFRPQNSRHNDPMRRAHTIQYIGNPMYTWHYLREKAPEKYGNLLEECIAKKRMKHNRYLRFGLEGGFKLAEEDYVGVMMDLGFTRREANSVYPHILAISERLGKAVEQAERSMLISPKKGK